MEIAHQRIGEVDVLELDGRLGSLTEAPRLRQRIVELAIANEPRIVLDMTGLKRVDSGFIGELLECRDRVLKRRGQLRLVLTGAPRDMCLMARLDTIFEIFDDQQEAVKHVTADESEPAI